MSETVDVAIVGYGPVGQALAIALAQHGHRVLVADRWPALYPLPRAVVYDHEVARILQSLGVADAMHPHTASSKTYEWRNGQGQTLKLFSGLDEIGISGWPDKLGFYQPQLEAILDARVRSFGARVEVLQGWEAESAVDEGEWVRLTLRAVQAGDASPRVVNARYLVGCDGAGSMVRQAMGSGYEDLGFSADWLVVDVKPIDPTAWSGENIQVCDPARPTTLVASGPGRRRAEFMLLPGESKESVNNAKTAWRLLAPHGWTPANAMLERHAVYTFRGCIASRWRAGRMMLAGDAAHLTPPFAGQGLCAGLRDVAALAWRLNLVLRSQATEALFDSYGVERAPHVRRFIDFAIELGNVICVLDPAQAAGRDAFLLGPGAQGEDRYPESSLPPSDLLRSHDAAAGALSLQAPVRDGDREGRFDDLAGHGWMLIAWAHDPTASLGDTERALLDRLGVRCVVVGGDSGLGDPGSAYARWFRELRVRCALVRPDFYLFGAGEASDLLHALARVPALNA